MIRLVHEVAAREFPVVLTCRVLQFAPSTYCEAIKRQPSAREIEEQNLTSLIVEIYHVHVARMARAGSMPNCERAWVFGSVVNTWHASCEEPVFTVSLIGENAGIVPTRRRTMIW